MYWPLLLSFLRQFLLRLLSVNGGLESHFELHVALSELVLALHTNGKSHSAAVEISVNAAVHAGIPHKGRCLEPASKRARSPRFLADATTCYEGICLIKAGQS